MCGTEISWPSLFRSYSNPHGFDADVVDATEGLLNFHWFLHVHPCMYNPVFDVIQSSEYWIVMTDSL